MAHTSHDSAHAEILIRRSALNGLPVQSGTGFSLLRVGELAYSFLADPEDDGFGNGGDRLYVGVGNELTQTRQLDGEGDSYNRLYSQAIATIGGKYFTDMMNHQRGIVEPASALLVDDNKKLNELLVDYLYFDKDSVSTEATNDLVLRAGTQDVIINSRLTVQDSALVEGDLTVNAGGSPITSDIVLPTANHVGSGTYDSKIKIGPSGSETKLGRGFLSQSNNGLVIVAGSTPSNLSPSENNNWMTLNNNASGGIKFNVEAGGTIGKFEVDLNGKYSYFHSGESRFDSVRPNADNTYDLGDSAFRWKKIWAYAMDSTTVEGDLTVTKNLYVQGETTNISTTELLVEDKQIIIADGTPSAVLADGSGIAVGDSDSPYAFMKYENNGVDSAQWRFSPKIFSETLEFEVIDCGTYA